MLVFSEIDDKEFADLYKAQRYLRHPSPVMLSLVLTGLVILSKKPKMVSRGSARGAMLVAGAWGMRWLGPGWEDVG